MTRECPDPFPAPTATESQKRLESAPKPHLGRSLTRDKILVRRSTDPLRSLAMSCRRVAPTPPAGRPGPRGTRTGAARPRIVGGDDLALPVVAVAVELAGSHHPAERGARPLVQGGHLVGERHVGMAFEEPTRRSLFALMKTDHFTATYFYLAATILTYETLHREHNIRS